MIPRELGNSGTSGERDKRAGFGIEARGWQPPTIPAGLGGDSRGGPVPERRVFPLIEKPPKDHGVLLPRASTSPHEPGNPGQTPAGKEYPTTAVDSGALSSERGMQDIYLPRRRVETSELAIKRFRTMTLPVIDIPKYFWDLPEDLNSASAKSATRLGTYTINPTDPKRLIEEGAEGLILGASTSQGNRAAIKISYSSSTTATEVFRRQAMFHGMAAEVTTNVTKLLEAGTIFLTSTPTSLLREFATIVTDYVPGPNLEVMNRGKRPLGISEAVSRFASLGEAVDAIGQAGIVHRDIKPSNIMMKNGEKAILIDFGIATTSGAIPEDVFGSPRWRSPEHEKVGAPLSPATNIYQLGLNVFTQITRKHLAPTMHEDGYILDDNLQTAAYERNLAKRFSQVYLPGATEEVFSKVFALNPRDRYTTASDFLGELDRAQHRPNPTYLT